MSKRQRTGGGGGATVKRGPDVLPINCHANFAAGEEPLRLGNRNQVQLEMDDTNLVIVLGSALKETKCKNFLELVSVPGHKLLGEWREAETTIQTVTFNEVTGPCSYADSYMKLPEQFARIKKPIQGRTPFSFDLAGCETTIKLMRCPGSGAMEACSRDNSHAATVICSFGQTRYLRVSTAILSFQ